MDFNLNEIIKLSEEIAQSKEIKLIDVPSIDLYMDQVTTLFEDKLSHLKRTPEETILTKTMINNYAKSKILTPIKNKKYNRSQILTLILIYNLKQILSLEDIKVLFDPLLTALQKSPEKSTLIEELYSKFINIKEKQSSEFDENISTNIEAINLQYAEETDSSLQELVLTVLTLINSANMQKRLAEKLIDSYFKKNSSGSI